HRGAGEPGRRRGRHRAALRAHRPPARPRRHEHAQHPPQAVVVGDGGAPRPRPDAHARRHAPVRRGHDAAVDPRAGLDRAGRPGRRATAGVGLFRGVLRLPRLHRCLGRADVPRLPPAAAPRPRAGHMTATDPRTDHPAPTRDVVAALRSHGVADVDDSDLARALYSSDASLYRIPPRVVVRPRDVDEVAAVLAAARETGTPITPRGAGTSIAGNAVGPGIVIDFLKHLDQVHHVDPERRTARVDPGAVHAVLQRAARPHGLRFGPDPSTHTRCTIGGMIGNNACGSRALAYGRTVDNVEALDVLTVDGRQLRLGPGAT